MQYSILGWFLAIKTLPVPPRKEKLAQFIIWIATAAFANSLYATTLFVGNCGSPTSPSIQAAVNTATNGDTVTICSGTYNEAVTVNKGNNATSITIQGNTANAVDNQVGEVTFAIKATSVNFKNLTIQSSNSTIITTSGAMGGLSLFNTVLNPAAVTTGYAINLTSTLSGQLSIRDSIIRKGGVFVQQALNSPGNGTYAVSIDNLSILNSADKSGLYFSNTVQGLIAKKLSIECTTCEGIHLSALTNPSGYSLPTIFDGLYINASSGTAIRLTAAPSAAFNIYNTSTFNAGRNTLYSGGGHGIGFNASPASSGLVNIDASDITTTWIASGIFLGGSLTNGLTVTNSTISGYSGITTNSGANVGTSTSNQGLLLQNLNISATTGSAIDINGQITSGGANSFIIDNVIATSSGSYGLNFGGQISVAGTIKNSKFTSKSQAIRFGGAIPGGINIELSAATSSNSHAIEFNASTGSPVVSISGVTAKASGKALYIASSGTTSSISSNINNSSFESYADDALYLGLLGTGSASTQRVTDSCIRTTASNASKYAFNNQVNFGSASYLSASNSCFFSPTDGRQAYSVGTKNTFSGNYWFGHIGSFSQNNINDTGSLSSCPLACAPASTSTLVAQFKMEDWGGTTSAVPDTGGYAGGPFNGYSASPYPVVANSSPARASDPGTCAYSVFSGPISQTGTTTPNATIDVPNLPLGTASYDATSVTYWMYWDGTDNTIPLGWLGYSLEFKSSYFGFNTDNGDIFGISSSGLKNGWHHIAAVFVNGLVNASKIYIDGVPATLSQKLGTPNVSASTASASGVLRIGGEYGWNGWRFSGRIDEVKIYRGAITASQVSTDFASTHPCGATPTNAVGFTCVEQSTQNANASTGRIFTKKAGAPFYLDVVALKSDGTVETSYANVATRPVFVELVDGSGSDTTCKNRSTLSPSVSQTLIFDSTDHGRKSATFTVGKSYRDLRCRVTDASQTPNIVGCSSDNFAIRPSFITVTSSNATNGSGAGTPKYKTGQYFNLTATASPGSGYDGTPSIDISKIQAHSGALRTGQLSGVFGSAQPSSGISIGNEFSYDEVGNLKILANGVYDNAFTAVDNAFGDCAPGFQDSLGKFACNIGSAETAFIGRFIPDHFTMTATAGRNAITPANGSFSYMNQTFAAQVEIEARNHLDLRTQNYDSALAKSIVTLAAENADDGKPLTGRLTGLSGGVWSAGAYTLNTTVAEFARLGSPPYLDGPFDALAIGASVLDPDNDASTPLKLGELNMDPATSGNCITSVGGCTHKKIGSDTSVRFGRLVVSNAHGSSQLQLTVPLQTQYWAGSAWATNSLDSKTNVSEKIITTPAPCASATGGAIVSGHGYLTLNAPNAYCSIEICILLFNDSDNPISNCRVAGGKPMPWLQGSWDADGIYGDNPIARASFGVELGNKRIIYRRERY